MLDGNKKNSVTMKTFKEVVEDMQLAAYVRRRIGVFGLSFSKKLDYTTRTRVFEMLAQKEKDHKIIWNAYLESMWSGSNRMFPVADEPYRSRAYNSLRALRLIEKIRERLLVRMKKDFPFWEQGFSN